MVFFSRLPVAATMSVVLTLGSTMMTPVHGRVAPAPPATTTTMVWRSATPGTPFTSSCCWRQRERCTLIFFALSTATACDRRRSSRDEFFRLTVIGRILRVSSSNLRGVATMATLSPLNNNLLDLVEKGGGEFGGNIIDVVTIVTVHSFFSFWMDMRRRR